MNKKQLGRPKLYDSTADKLDAFRKRIESAGYMRKEILVTEDTWEQVTTLAKENGVSASDAASGLLEYGVRSLLAKKAPAPVMFSRKQVEPVNLAAGVVPIPRKKPGANPIADFFSKRKESVQTSLAKKLDASQE